MFLKPIGSSPFGNKLALIEVLPDHTRETVASVLVIAIGYFLGSAVIRISETFFNDELWRALPTESSIRASIYRHEYCDIHGALKDLDLNLPLELGHAAKAEQALCSGNVDHEPQITAVTTELFRVQEARLLLDGEDKTVRLKEFHDQIVVLRGGLLNGVVLFLLSLFGICACYRARSRNGLQRTIFYLPTSALLAYGLFSLGKHISKGLPIGGDPPLAELILILLGFFGLLACNENGAAELRFFRNIWCIAAVLSLIAYGAWWWTEVRYDEHVIHSTFQNQGPATSMRLVPDLSLLPRCFVNS
jgi:hypothetical protein